MSSVTSALEMFQAQSQTMVKWWVLLTTWERYAGHSRYYPFDSREWLVSSMRFGGVSALKTSSKCSRCGLTIVNDEDPSRRQMRSPVWTGLADVGMAHPGSLNFYNTVL